MKTIQAIVLPNRFDSRLLEDRRYRPNLDTAAIKRHSRRQERHIAQHRLRKDVAALGIDILSTSDHKDPVRQAKAPAAPLVKRAPHSNPHQAAVVIMFPLRETAVAAREITVIRKRPFQRASVEKMLLAA